MAQNTLLVGVYETEPAARAAADAARRAGAADHEVRVDDPLDRVAALKSEMRDEFDRSVGGPGVGPLTKEMAKGATVGAMVGGAIGAVLALPAAAFDWGLPLWARLLIVAVCGAACGSTVGWVLGGGFGARRPQEPLDTEQGVIVAAPATEPVERALITPGLIRLTLVNPDGTPLEVVATSADPSMLHEMGRHVAEEDRRD